MDQPSRHPAATGHRGVAAEHRIGVGLGGDRRMRNRYHEPPSAGNLRACDEPPRRVAACPRHAVRPAYGCLEKFGNAGVAVRCSSSIGAIPEDRGQQCRQGQPTMHASYGHPSGPAARPGLDDRLTCWRAPAPYLSTTTLKASVGRKPQQPVISPAKKIRPGRCGAATLRLVAANAPTASNQSTSRMGGGCKVQWTPRPRRCRPVG
jgi:hypothetical protein